MRLVYSDASNTVEDGIHIAHGSWLAEEAKQSSTWRELVAVLEAIVSKLNNGRLRRFTAEAARI